LHTAFPKNPPIRPATKGAINITGAKASGINTIASGGVKDISDIEALKRAGDVYGAIVGKAYYEGTLDLKEAFKLVR